VGDDSLVDRLYQRYASALLAFLRQHTATLEDAEDLLLEVFRSALEQKSLGDLAEKQQAAWLWRVARNMAIDRYRRSSRHPVLELEQVAAELYEDETHSPEQSALLREEDELRQDGYRRLQDLVRSLSPLQQEVLRLRFALGLQSPQIAEVLGKKPSMIRVLLLRTLRHLQTMYSNSSSPAD
jgi:RNA polymerase sigma factor (sigma-70 family)